MDLVPLYAGQCIGIIEHRTPFGGQKLALSLGKPGLKKASGQRPGEKYHNCLWVSRDFSFGYAWLGAYRGGVIHSEFLVFYPSFRFNFGFGSVSTYPILSFTYPCSVSLPSATPPRNKA